MRALLALLVIALSSAVAATTCAEAAESPQVSIGSTVMPLRGAVAFCQSVPDRCTKHSSAIVEMSELRFAELYVVNLLVNETITYEREPPEVDIWQDRDFTVGDCEDFALLKRRKLISAGWPPGALRIAIVLKRPDDDQLHAVLVASTNRGDFVLDIPDVDSKEPVAIRMWNPNEFAELRMIWGADGEWYALGSDVKSVSAAQ